MNEETQILNEIEFDEETLELLHQAKEQFTRIDESFRILDELLTMNLKKLEQVNADMRLAHNWIEFTRGVDRLGETERAETD